MTLAELQSALEILQTRVEHPLPQMQPFGVELSYPIARQSNSKKCGITSKVTFDVDQDVYEKFQHGLPQGVVLRGLLWVEEETAEIHEKPAKPEKPPKGDYGYFWQYLWNPSLGFVSHPDLAEMWDELSRQWPGRDRAQIIRDCFGGRSRTTIAPRELREWLRVRRIPAESSVYVLIDQAERETAGRAAGK